MIIMLASGLMIPSAFADTTMEISVNKSILTQPFEKFLISGTVLSTEPIREIQIRIFDPDGTLVYSPTIPLGSDGTFTNVARVESSWIQDGSYSVELSSDKVEGVASTQIQLQMGAEPIIRPNGMMVSGFMVENNINDNIQSTFVDPEDKTITFILTGEIEANEFRVTLPPGLITNPNAVWVDGDQIFNFDTSIIGGETQLVIPVQANSKEVVIMGTAVVPEFGAIALPILIVGIIVTILVTSKIQRFGLLRI